MIEKFRLAGIRTRKAFRNGAKLFAINPVDYDYHFAVSEKVIVSPQEMPMQVAKLLLAMTDDVKQLPEEVQKLLLGLQPDKATSAIAKALKQSDTAIITGALCENHPDASLVRTLLHVIAEHHSVKLLRLTSGANSAGACLAGMLPHRTVAAKLADTVGMDIQTALNAKLKGYFLLAVEPGFDFANPYRRKTIDARRGVCGDAQCFR